MFVSVILAFCAVSPRGTKQGKFWRILSLCLRGVGLAGMIYCALTFHGRRDQPIITLAPLVIHTSWYGILGLIGWAYLVGAVVFLVFRGNRTALLGCVVLLMCLYPADRKGLFGSFWLGHYVGIGETLGSQAAITVAGLLLASILAGSDTVTVWMRARFALLFIAGCSAAAWLLTGLYGISKNDATPSWCLWSSAITAALWLAFYFICDVRPVGFIAKPLAIAGQNVLLAYLLSEMLGGWLDLLNLGDWYDGLAADSLRGAVTRSAGCGLVLLCLTAGLNRIGFRLKL
jgi:predicted acyltransferase